MIGTGGRRGKFVRKGQRFVLLPVACLLLANCTLIMPPPVRGLPDRSAIHAGEEIIVGKNQNVYGIARKHDVSMRDLIVLNDLQPPFTLKPGQSLVLPAKAQDYAPAPMASPIGGIEEGQLEPFAAAPLSSQDVTTEPLEAPVAPRTDAQSTLMAPSLPPSKSFSTTVMPAEQKTAALVLPSEPAPSSKSGLKFAWPVQGPVVSDFGRKPQGTNNDGINISAPKGAPVAAAAGGIVVYAGNEMKGFGNLVLIRHEGGWVTAYAHLDRMLVNKDTVVAPGDMIGTIGSSGGVGTPQLHFETRLDGKAVDPQTVIGRSS